jgi:hypothetical protein
MLHRTENTSKTEANAQWTQKNYHKKIPVSVDYPKMIEDGLIEAQNCSHCWKKMGDKGIDAMALRVLFKLFYQYQEEDKIPEYISILS